ncbi:MAG: AAA family ATPase [Vulcanimicrobiaceae bacterium]
MRRSALPRLAPSVVVRPRISDWLERHAALPLRLLAGPAGTGKTTAVVSYLAEHGGGYAYVALKADDSPELLRERIAAALGLSYVPASFPALVAAIATAAPCEIVLDQVERATQETLEEIAELASEAPLDVSFIVLARSRCAVDGSRMVARGLGAILDAAALAFDAGEIARLCEAHGIAYAPAEVAHFLEETEGWPLVASWALREAASAGAPLGTAFERWSRTSARHFREFIDGELAAAGDSYRAAFRIALRDAPQSRDDRERLAALEAKGLFVTFADEAYRPYRVARQLDLGAAGTFDAGRPDPSALLVVRLFGRFDARIGDRPIVWIRRREAQIFKYLLLKPKGSASRTELRELFWPQADHHLATQSLRTACSNIRKALAALVGYANVERYFTTRGEIAVDLASAVIDARRFTAHVADGDAERERTRLKEAFAHYRAAESLYSGELLAGEYPEPWYAARAAMYRALYRGVLERIAEYHAEGGRMRHAREYAARAQELRAPDEVVGVASLQPA